MAKREISLVLRAKNELQVGLAKAMSTLQGFGSSVLSVGKWISGAFLAAGVAVAAFAAKALSAYAESEKASMSLKASFRAYGEEVDLNTQKIEMLAKTIQNETGISDENLVARAARLKLLGVETAALGDAMKATVALAAVGMDEEAAIKAVAQAREGNFSMLQRYIPALRSATTEEEKVAILNGILAGGYQQQQAILGTVSGQWVNFKERIGDVWEEFGALIAQSGTVTRILEFASEKVKLFGQAINEWAQSERFQEIQMSIEGIINAIAKGGPDRAQAITAIGEYLKAALARGAEIAGQTLKELAPKVGQLIASGFKSLMGSREATNQAAQELGLPESEGYFSVGPLGGIHGVEPGIKKAVELRAQQIRLEQEILKTGVDITAGIEGQTAAQMRLANAESILLALGKEYGQIQINNSNRTLQAAAPVIEVKQRERQLNEDLIDDAYESADAEIQASYRKVAANTEAAKQSTESWLSAYENMATASEQSAMRAISSAKQIQEEMTNTGFNEGAKGGTIETPANWSQAVKNLTASGVIPATGTRLMPGESNRIQQLILAELQKIRGQNEQLLTFG